MSTEWRLAQMGSRRVGSVEQAKEQREQAWEQAWEHGSMEAIGALIEAWEHELPQLTDSTRGNSGVRTI